MESEKREYYYLPVDCYGQPRGDVYPVELTEAEADQWRRMGRYLFDDYRAALYRAMD